MPRARNTFKCSCCAYIARDGYDLQKHVQRRGHSVATVQVSESEDSHKTYVPDKVRGREDEVSRYSEGKVYIIRCRESDEVYVGSTVHQLAHRFAGHKNEYKQWCEGLPGSSYCSSYRLLVYPSAYIELVKAAPCNSRRELLAIEMQVAAEQFHAVNIARGRCTFTCSGCEYIARDGFDLRKHKQRRGH